MDWSDEHYVKLFTRDTVTWRSWPWQARCLLAMLLRKVDAAGIFDCGRKEPALALAIMVEMPSDVVAPGLEALLADGTAEFNDGKLVLPNFVDAQESKKTDKAKARDYRNRKRDHARAKVAKQLDSTVTARHQASPRVTVGDPPALPCPALPVPEKIAGPTPKKPKAEKPQPDPRHAPMVKAFCEAFERETGAKYPFSGIDAAAVTALLAKGLEPTLLAAWTKALRSTAYPVVRTLPELARNLAHFVGTAPPTGSTRVDESTKVYPEGNFLT